MKGTKSYFGKRQWLIWALFFGGITFISTSSFGKWPFGKQKVAAPDLSLSLRSQQSWVHTFPEEIVHVYLARETGNVLAHSKQRVWYLDSQGQVVWSRGDKESWKYITGGGISNDGSRVVFQTDVNPKEATNLLNLTVHYVTGEGEELWAKPNPYRYNVSQLSPSGHYILFGDAFEKGIRLHDDQLDRIWEKDLYLWYIVFDPTETYVFDSVDGLLFNIQGRQVFDFGARGNKVFGISDMANEIMVKQFLSAKSADMFLMCKKMLKRVDFKGLGGCVSPDGSLTAVVTENKKLRVLDTKTVLEKESLEVEPIYSTSMLRAQVMSIARDNRTLFVKGDDISGQSLLMLVDIEHKNIIWRLPPPNNTRKAQGMLNNEGVMVFAAPSTVYMLKGKLPEKGSD